jgi:hypothetical protein
MSHDANAVSIVPRTPENMALIQRAVERVAARLARGEGPPKRELPIRKSAFPKLLCLDQNKWIDLARAHYRRNGGEPFADALAAVREAISKDRIIVPVMPSNLIEVSEPADEGRRQRLAEFMVDVSGNHSMLNPKNVERAQLRHAVIRNFMGQDPGPFRRDRLVAWGMSYALGKQMTGDAFLTQALEEPEVSVLAMVHAMSRDAFSMGADSMPRQLLSRARRALRISPRRSGAKPSSTICSSRMEPPPMR